MRKIALLAVLAFVSASCSRHPTQSEADQANQGAADTIAAANQSVGGQSQSTRANEADPVSQGASPSAQGAESSIEMTGTYYYAQDVNSKSSAITEIQFSGLGYCKAFNGDRHSMRSVWDGRCELRNGGMEFNNGAGVIKFFRIQHGWLINEDGNALVKQ